MLASFSIIPMGVGEELKEYIADVIGLVESAGLNYRLGAMQTTIEGDADEVISLIMKCHALMKDAAPRVVTSITIDDRAGAEGRLTGKVDDVEKVLGRTVSHE